MWGIITLLLLVSVATLLMKPREPFYEDVSELDVLKGFNLDFNKTFDALKDKSIGEFKSVMSKEAAFEKAAVTDELRVKNLRVTGNNLTIGNSLTLGNQTLTAADIQKLKSTTAVFEGATINNDLTVNRTLRVGNQTLTAADIQRLKRL
jgi:hypothetical protein